jgi:dsRNA-specific ribonuclease
VEALIGIYYIDGGVQGALQFLVFCGILRTEIFRVRELDPLMLILGDGRIGHEEQLEKLKRRKITPMTNIILSSQTSSESTDSTTFSELLKETQALTAPVGQKIENVQPNVPSFAAFPFADLESSLSYAFLHRELAFMACTHTSADLKLNGEKLEWIGDAAIDWIVCRHYWYNYRLKTADDDEFEEGAVTLGADNSSGDSSSSKPMEHDLCAFNSTNNNLEHPNVCHIPKGYLPLSPESLTNSRQSAINNEAFARLVIKNDLHRFLRINSPHLQIEIERFAEELSKQAGGGGEAGNTSKLGNNILTPEALEGFQTHVSVAAPKVLGDLFESLMGALLLDTNFDIECFSTLFEPFLNSICPDPSSLPINAIQETLHLYARLGIPRHQIVCTYKSISESDNQCLGVICQVWVRERCVAEAEGSNKLVAKKLAMESALKELINNSTNYP